MAQLSHAHAALGSAIKGYRKGMKISQDELGALCGLHRTYVGGIERGERNVSYANILRLAGAVGLRASELLSRAEALEDAAALARS
jgi:transcriptional regulator with XRE-family HTH domain